MKEALGEQVSDVRASQRLTDSAACLVASGQGRDRELERLLARQNRGSRRQADPRAQHAPRAGEGAGAAPSAATRETTSPTSPALLLDQAQILDGEVPADPAAFAARLNRLVVRGLG